MLLSNEKTRKVNSVPRAATSFALQLKIYTFLFFEQILHEAKPFHTIHTILISTQEGYSSIYVYESVSTTFFEKLDVTWPVWTMGGSGVTCQRSNLYLTEL